MNQYSAGRVASVGEKQSLTFQVDDPSGEGLHADEGSSTWNLSSASCVIIVFVMFVNTSFSVYYICNQSNAEPK